MTATNMCSNFGSFRCRPPYDQFYALYVILPKNGTSMIPTTRALHRLSVLTDLLR